MQRCAAPDQSGRQDRIMDPPSFAERKKQLLLAFSRSLGLEHQQEKEKMKQNLASDRNCRLSVL